MNTKDALAACLPPVAYDRAAPELAIVLGALSAVLDDAVTSANEVVTEQQPDLTSLALEDWERNYALPDEALGGATASEADRRANLLARMNAKGNLSRAHLIELAAVVGFPGATITEYDVMTCEDPCDSAVADDSWIGAWHLDVVGGTGSQALLQRLMQRRKPAHTVFHINFA